MKIKIQHLTICLFLLCFSVGVRGANVYILQSSSCMDRLVYSNTTNGVTTQLITYRLKINPVEQIFLEIGSENQVVQEFLPTQVYSCGSNIFNEKLVESINSNKDKVFLVIKLQNNKYSVNQVSQAAYFQHIGNNILYNSSRYSFALNLDRGVIGEDISVGEKSKDSQIFFEGKLETDCSGAFLFRKLAPKEARPHTDFVLIPELGLSENRNGLNADDAFNNVLRLEKINDYTPQEYLRLLCQEKEQPTAKTDDLTVKDIPKEFDQTPQTSTGTQTKTVANNPCGEAPSEGYHMVQKGETLYRISKQYNVTVSQIKSWNGLGQSNTIYPCSKLRVVESIATTTTQKPQEAIAGNTPVVNVPAPYENNNFTVKGASNQNQTWEKAWEKTNGYHVVLPGETVASIAMKYGYTEERFRDINGLGKDEMIKIGQPLKTTDCPMSIGTITSSTDAANTSDRPTEFSNYTGAPTLTAKTPYYSSSSTSTTTTNPSSYDFNNDNRITPQFYMQSDVPKDLQVKGGTTLSPELARRAANTTSTQPSSYDNTVPQSYENSSSIKRATHTVKDGDTLYSIARMYGISVERLRMLNNMSGTDVIVPYQRLYIN